MGLYDRIYKEEHRQLSRIASYSAIFSKFPVILMLILLSMFVTAALVFGHILFGIVAGTCALVVLTLNLVAKYQVCCPKCKQPFFGKFALFAPYIDRCQNCEFPIVPGEPVKLDIQDM